MKHDTALLIVDVQVAMFSYEDLPLYHGEQVLSNIKSLLEAARGTGLPIVYVQHTDDEEYTKGTPTWAICPQIAPLPSEHVVEKSECDAFCETGLQDTLRTLGVTQLIIVGMQTELCIDTTCRRAHSLGYESVLVSDAHSTYDSAILSAAQIIAHENDVLGGGQNGRFARLKTTTEAIDWIKHL